MDLYKISRQLKLFRRKIYGVRTFIPWLREVHKMESMIGPLGLWSKMQAYQFQALVSNGLEPQHTLLDIGCGPLQGGIVFIKYLAPNKYFGIDINEEHLNAGKKQVLKNNLLDKKPFLSVSKYFGSDVLNGNCFDFIWASQVLYYFNTEMIKSLMELISSRLKENGKFLGDIIGPEHYEFKTHEYGWYLHTIDSLKDIAKDYKLNVRDIGRLTHYGYPRRVGMRNSIMIEITKNK